MNNEQNLIRIDFNNENQLKIFTDFFKSKLFNEYTFNKNGLLKPDYKDDGKKFCYERKNYSITLWEIKYEINDNTIIIQCDGKLSDDKEELNKSFVDFMENFNFDYCTIIYLCYDYHYFGSFYIQKTEDCETLELLDYCLKNNERSLTNNIIDYIPKYNIMCGDYGQIEWDDIVQDVEIDEPIENSINIKNWFIENDYEVFYPFWLGSCWL